jgi:hypothetical protein
VARIESAPDRTSFDQITKLVALLGGRVVIEDADQVARQKPKPTSVGW